MSAAQRARPIRAPFKYYHYRASPGDCAPRPPTAGRARARAEGIIIITSIIVKFRARA